MFKKTLSTEGLGISGVDSEIIELAVTYGFKGIDQDLVDLYHRAENKGALYAGRLLESAGLKIGTFTLPVVWQEGDEAYQRDMAALPQMAEVAQQLKCNRLRTTVLPACDARPYHENFEFHRRRIAEMAKALAPYDISLGLAFQAPAELRQDRAFEFIHNLDELRKLVEAIGQDNVGVTLDVWHWHASGGTMDDITALSVNQIVAVHFADAPSDVAIGGLTERHRMLPSPSGVIDCVSVLRRLAEIGYKGPITAKSDRGRFPKTGRAEIVKQVADSLNQLWSAAELSPTGKLAAAAATA